MRRNSVRKKIQDPNTILSINLGKFLNLKELQFLYLQSGINHTHLFGVLWRLNEYAKQIDPDKLQAIKKYLFSSYC